MSDMKHYGHNFNRLSPLGGKDDGSFAEDRFNKNDFRPVIGDIISSKKTSGNIHTFP